MNESNPDTRALPHSDRIRLLEEQNEGLVAIVQQLQQEVELLKGQPRIRVDANGKFVAIDDILISWDTQACQNHPNGQAKYPAPFVFPTQAENGVAYSEPPHLSVAVNSQSNGNPPVAFGVYGSTLTKEQYSPSLYPVLGSGQPAVDMSYIAIGESSPSPASGNQA